ncbi:flavin reductase family protein [Terribacillus sp. 7520-G]|uniref:flavin reductase family protein n=1 Tax=unclassified Terribacillus TaxID=2636508 RepID=UPI000BA5B1BA|nr:flavin reductase family protein [Terribacillus sp. 7520-G]PAD37997.1 flavin reductase [Terribacillus sp. 7520-G]
MDNRTFRDAMGKFATGITIVTTDVAGETKGMTVNAFMSVSLEPKLIAVSIDKKASLYNVLQTNPTFGVSVLREEQKDISMVFAKQKEEEPVPIIALHDVPVVEDALVNLACKTVDKVMAGDHMIIIGEVEDLLLRDGDPVLYFGGNYREIKSI